MSSLAAVKRSGRPGLIHRLLAVVSPNCVICGRGHAQIGWVTDPTGRPHGRCQGCTEEAVDTPVPRHKQH